MKDTPSSDNVAITANGVKLPHKRGVEEKRLTMTTNWPKDRKHFFIFSSAGKPVYSRYGDEFVISSYLGVAQAIISSFESSGDQIRCINAGRHRFVFLNRYPLYLLTVSTSGESESQLRGQLLHLYNQLLSILTAPQLARLFNKRVNFDLRRLLAGTEKLFDSIVDAMSMQPITEVKSVRTARLDASLRSAVTQAFRTAHVKEAGYAALFINNCMVSYAHPRKHPLHPFDLHILTNMVTTSTNYGSGETWTPLCLPRLNRTAFVSAYISYLAPQICFVAVSHDKDAFFALSHYQSRLKESLEVSGYFEKLLAISKEEAQFSIADVGIPGLRHCMFRSTQSKQIAIADAIESSEEEKQRLFRLYQQAADLLRGRSAPSMFHYRTTATETLLAWSSASFELYAIFGPFISKASAIIAINSLLRWIQKAEHTLFATQPVLL